MRKKNEKGIALILTLILLLVMSVMAVSLMFISQTETWSGLNYRLMSQARDGAEAGVNAAANYIAAGNTETDPITAYNYTNVWPVQVGSGNTSGHDVYLSGNTSVQSSNYPASAIQTAFNASGVGKGSITAGNTTINYATYARMLSMTKLNSTITGLSPTVQSWEITSDGTIDGIRPATVEVSAVLEQTIVPTFSYAAFATDPNCSALRFGGGGSTNSYDSSTYSGTGTPAISTTGGNVGTNGGLDTSGSTTYIYGTLSTPRTGVGTCSSSNVTAWTGSSGQLSCGPSQTNSQCLVELPQAVVYPTPTVPAAGTVDIATNQACPSMTGTGGSCIAGTGACPSGTMCLAPSAANGTMSLHTLDLTGSTDLHLAAGTYNIDSITETGNTRLIIDSTPVIMNVTGSGGGDVVKLTGGGLTNTFGAFDPLSFQIVYAGTGNIKLAGGSASVGVMYAPNASYSLTGGSDWYGALIGKTLTDMGGTAIHYDRRLQKEDFIPGAWMLSSFTWKKY